MLKARHGGDVETEKVVQSVAEGMLAITETRGQDAVEDWEVDELLEWTNGLNFDQYVDQQFFFCTISRHYCAWTFCKQMPRKLEKGLLRSSVCPEEVM